MTIDYIAWLFGTLFSLSIFAFKVGIGLGAGRFNIKTISAILFVYFLGFVCFSLLGHGIINIVLPVLRQGTVIHIVMAAGMILWGIYLIFLHNHSAEAIWKHSLLLVIPCPVCLSAMAFSTFAAINTLKIPAIWAGVFLGMAFVLLSLIFLYMCRLIRIKEFNTGIGLAMLGIGLYFIGSLIIPAKIAEAKAIFDTMQSKSFEVNFNDLAGVLMLLTTAFFAGVFLKIK